MIGSVSAREGGVLARLYSGAGARAAAEPQHVRMVLVTVQNIRNRGLWLPAGNSSLKRKKRSGQVAKSCARCVIVNKEGRSCV